jgi:hypothetical protein
VEAGGLAGGLATARALVAELYEAFAEGGGYPMFEEAPKRHEQLKGMLNAWSAWGLKLFLVSSGC